MAAHCTAEIIPVVTLSVAVSVFPPQLTPTCWECSPRVSLGMRHSTGIKLVKPTKA